MTTRDDTARWPPRENVPGASRRSWAPPGWLRSAPGPQIQGLHGSVGQAGHGAWTWARSSRGGDRDATSWQRSITMLAHSRYGHGFGLGRVPDDLLHPRRPLPWVVRHPFPRPPCGGNRLGEQTLQGVHRAPAAPLGRLRATRVEPASQRMGLLPVQGLPVHRGAGARTSRCCHGCPRLCLLRRFPRLAREARPA